MRLILFDCDGTLVDSQHVIVGTMTSAFAEHGLPAPVREDVLSIVGLSLEPAIARLLGGRASLASDVASTYRTHFHRERGVHRARGVGPIEPLYPFAAETVRALAARDDVLLGIVTGKSRRGVEAVLGGHGLLDQFATIHTADDAPSKPHPAMVLQAIDRTGVGPDVTVVVGDTTYDMTMARAAGASAVGVAWGYHPPASLPEAGAETVISGFEELAPWLDARWADRGTAA